MSIELNCESSSFMPYHESDWKYCITDVHTSDKSAINFLFSSVKIALELSSLRTMSYRMYDAFMRSAYA